MRITATITIVETGQVTKDQKFENALAMLRSLGLNVAAAKLVFKRNIEIREPRIDGDNMVLEYEYTDTKEVWMRVEAVRHV